MRIAVASEGPDLHSKVADRLGLAEYLIIVDVNTMQHKAVKNSGLAAHSGILAVVEAIRENVEAVLAGYCSPIAESYLSRSKIKVITGVRGSVSEAIGQYKKLSKQQRDGSAKGTCGSFGKACIESLARTSRQFGKMLPILGGVILLIGLVKAFISKELLLSIFSGNVFFDTVLGAWLGSILPGNPINSYVIGGEMLENGVSLFAVTAFMMTWVSVGLVQLPAEMVALGRKFSLLRNVTSLVLSVAISIVTVLALRILGR